MATRLALNGPQMAQDARRWAGVRYAHMGRTDQGVDCVGLVVAAAAAQGVSIATPAHYDPIPAPHLLMDYLALNGYQRTTDGVQPGDILLFWVRSPGRVSHLAIAGRPGRMTHCLHDRGVVDEYMGRWYSRLDSVWRHG